MNGSPFVHLKNSLNRAPRIICGAFLLLLALAVAGCGGMSLRPFGEAEPVAGTADARGEAEGHGVTQTADGDSRPSATFMIRVGLAHGVDSASVTGRGSYTVSVYADEQNSWTARKEERWRFGADDSGVSGMGPGAGFHIETGTIRVKPEGDGPLVFDDVTYRGEIELFSSGPGSLTVVNVLDIESYLRGVVPKEIGPRPEEEIEAVKAQAVAARTYAIASGGKRAGGGFDVFATVEDQVYAGIEGENPVCDRAISETAGEFLSYGDEAIHAYFHANCGGHTEARHEVWGLERVPYLEGVPDSREHDRFNDAFCSGGAHFNWTETWEGEEIAALVREHLPSVASTPVNGPVGEVRGMRVTARTPSGRIRWLEVETDAGTYRVFGDRVRWLLRRPGTGRILLSAWFDLDVSSASGRVSRVEATGKGYGHGVGLCQHGAMEMARQRYTYDQILKHYYRGVELEEAY